jgi:hypothetical protein
MCVAIVLSDFQAQDPMLIGDHWWQVVEIVIGSKPTVIEIHCMCMCMSLGRILLQGSVLTNLFDGMRD